MGNRIMKTVDDGGQIKRTYYTRDAQGNSLATYANYYTDVNTTEAPTESSLWWIETPLYGSSRIGMVMPNLEVANATGPEPAWIRNYFKGKRQYELSNHLGNVLATIKDEKQQMQISPGTAIDYYNPILYSATDYYPFGMPMPNRTYSLSSEYRFGFNGKERVDEIYGEGNAIDFGARIYDGRIGRWLSVDPLQKKYPYASPYNFALNTPIQAKDPDGNVVLFINGQHTGNGGTASYWAGYDQKVMNKIGDHSARYIDGALGGWKNTGTAVKPTFMSTVVSLLVATNVSAKLRKVAGKVQGFNDAETIVNSLGDGESIKIVTHSMGTAYARGYVNGIKEWADKNDRKVRFEYELDVNAFQGRNLPASEHVERTDYKVGGFDNGNNKSEEIKGNSVPGVGPIPGGNDITQPYDGGKGHRVQDMSVKDIPRAEGNVLKNPNYYEQGSNNKNAP